MSSRQEAGRRFIFKDQSGIHVSQEREGVWLRRMNARAKGGAKLC